MNTITIHHKSEINAEGKHTNGNSKPVFCITTGTVYASVLDAAEHAGVGSGTMSRAITDNKKGAKCQGKRYCFVADVMDHFEEISQCSRAREEKVRAWDEITGKEEAKRKAIEKVEQLKASCKKLGERLARETERLADAEREMLLFENKEECYA